MSSREHDPPFPPVREYRMRAHRNRRPSGTLPVPESRPRARGVEGGLDGHDTGCALPGDVRIGPRLRVFGKRFGIDHGVGFYDKLSLPIERK